MSQLQYVVPLVKTTQLNLNSPNKSNNYNLIFTFKYAISDAYLSHKIIGYIQKRTVFNTFLKISFNCHDN